MVKSTLIGNNNNGFRDYNPAGSFYLESDPLGLAAGVNPFGYAGQNPVTHVDRRGLSPADEVPAIVEEIAPGLIEEIDSALSPINNAIGGLEDEAIALIQEESAAASGGTSTAGAGGQCVIGRVQDLKILQAGERSLLDRLPNLGSPQANWKNSAELQCATSRDVI